MGFLRQLLVGLYLWTGAGCSSVSLWLVGLLPLSFGRAPGAMIGSGPEFLRRSAEARLIFHQDRLPLQVPTR